MVPTAPYTHIGTTYRTRPNLKDHLPWVGFGVRGRTQSHLFWTVKKSCFHQVAPCYFEVVLYAEDNAVKPLAAIATAYVTLLIEGDTGR